jgi:hypothetical protein
MTINFKPIVNLDIRRSSGESSNLCLDGEGDYKNNKERF